MKKIVKTFAAFAVAAMVGTGIMSCSNGNDEGVSGPAVTPKPSDTTEVPDSVKTPDLTAAPVAAGEIRINGTVFNGTFAEAVASITDDSLITLAPGTYECNNVHYRGNADIKIKGLGSAKYGADVILAGKGDNTAASTEKTRSTFEYEGSGTLILENLTIKNTLIRSESPSSQTQCEALGFDGAYCAAYNCGFFAYQDTVRTIGKSWFYGCYIEGDVDFMWMEKSGKVALYENCAIKTVYDTSDGKTPNAYILAPGMTASDIFNKGLVVYNSAVLASVKTDFFRNPWGTSESLYNIGAFINIKLEGKENLSSTLQKSTASNWDLNDAIGWKIDQALANEITERSSEIHVISEALEEAEYNGRNRIINRVYKLNPGKYANDADVWDVNKLAADNGWKVTEDKSSLDEVSGDLKANGVYKIADYATSTTQYDPIPNGSSTDGFVSWTNFKYHGTAYGTVTSSDASIIIDAAGDSIVSFITSTYSNGTVTVTDEAGNKIVDGYSTKVATDKTAFAFVYTGAATKLTLAFTGTTYIGDLTVTKADGERPMIKKVSVSGDDALTVGDTITLRSSVISQYCADSSVTWSSSDENIASVNENGVVTGVAEGSAVIKATSVFDPSKSAEITVTVTGMPSAKCIWLDNTEASFAGRSTDTALVTVSDALHTNGGTWLYNASKLNGEGVVLTDSDENPEKGEWYVEYPVTAVKNVIIKKASINWGNTGTGNFFAYVTYQEDGQDVVVISDTNTCVRSTVNPSSTFVFDKELKAGKTAKIRISIHGDKSVNSGSGFQTLRGKCAVWGKTEITCQATEKPAPVIEETTGFNFKGGTYSGTNVKNCNNAETILLTTDKTVYEKVTFEGVKSNGADNWLSTPASSKITFNVNGACTLNMCCYNGQNNASVNLDGNAVSTSTSSDGADQATKYAYAISSAGTVTITFNGGYLGFFEVVY